MSSKRRISRRGMLYHSAAAAAGISAIFKATEAPAQAQQRPGTPSAKPGMPRGVQYGPINKYSAPSDLRITDLRAVTVASNFDYNIIRMDTNQGVYGLGEVRDGGLKGSALAMKPLLVGRNPLDITALLQACRPYTGPGRQSGGFSAIDICLHDLVGKVFGVPIWRLLGDKKRDRIRCYADTTGTPDPKAYAERMLKRKAMGFTSFKMDVTVNFASDYGRRRDAINDWGAMTDKGLGYACELIQAVRDALGWGVPLAVDASSGYRRVPGGPPFMPTKDAIRMAKAYEKFDLSMLEDLFSTRGFFRWQEFKEVKAATTTKIGTGEDAFGLEEGFKALIDNRAIDVVHPDPGTSGGCRETKRIADYAHQAGLNVMVHMAGSPVGTLAAAHSAATYETFHSMEVHALDFLDWWQKLVTKPVLVNGFIPVPDTPGLGVELNEEVVKEHLRIPGYFEPTPEYDQPIIVGRPPRGPWPHYDVNGKWVNEATSDY